MLKRILALMLAITIFGSTTVAQAMTFTDLKGSWAEKDILRLADLGIINGNKGKFMPNSLVTRAEFAKMMVVTLGMEDQAQVLAKLESPFSDLPVTHWSNGYIMLAYEQKILSGYPDNTIHPDSPISRLEATTLLVRTLGVVNPAAVVSLQSTSKAGNTGGALSADFLDEATFATWGKEYLDFGLARGLITGYADRTFRPDNYISRSESAVLAERLAGQQGRNLHLQGQVSAVNSAEGTISLDLAGQVVVFDVAGDRVFYKDQTVIGWKDILPGMQVAVILDSYGKIAFLEQTPETTGTAASLSLSLPSKANLEQGNSTQTSSQTGSVLDEVLPEDIPTSTYGEHPELSLKLTKAEMKVDTLTNSTNLNGAGQTIAIIDTGADPAHPDLLATASGKAKIVQYMDFTQEGLIQTPTRVTSANDRVELDGRKLRLPSAVSKSGFVHVGYWKENEIHGELTTGFDLNLNGNTTDQFPLVVVDNARAGVYDSVLVDTNGNGDFRDEILLKTYNTGLQFARFASPNSTERFGFVLAKLKADGSEINLGFDTNGHGTHVAGIAAGSGRLTGVAPGAQLMVLKAMDDSGTANWTPIYDAINYAASHGAKVVNLSLGQDVLLSTGSNRINKLLQTLMDTKGIVFVVAAGNSGPGLTTVTTPGDTEGVITVGAYISPTMWKQDYNWDVAKDFLWFYSSIGPRFDGAMMPQVLAPGSVVSTAPRGSYMLKDGTSMAAPHVTGVVALLLEGAARDKISVTPGKIRQALTLGAEKLEGFTEVEQGYGKIDAMGAWNQLRQLSNQPYIITKTYNPILDTGSGIYAREYNPGELDSTVQNLSTENLYLHLSTSQSWLKPKQTNIYLPGLTSRNVRMEFQRPEEPGLYTARLEGKVAGKNGLALDLLTTVINPYILDKSNSYRQTFTGDIAAGQYQRYFVKVPEGASNLKVTLNVPQQDGKYQGRARIHLYSPLGVEIDKDLLDFAGVGPDNSKSTAEKQVPIPLGGTWEIVIYSSATLSEYQLQSSRITLQVEAEEVTEPPLVEGNHEYVVSLNAGTFPAEQPEMVTLYVRARVTLQPYDGVISVNSKLYSVKGGSLTLVTPTGTWPDQWDIALPE